MTNDVINFGCRLNSYESEVIKQNLADNNLQDYAVFNTCAVTKEAERQARQAIRKFIRDNKEEAEKTGQPQKKIIITGCAAQIDPKSYADIEGVAKVIGNEEKLDKDFYKSLAASSGGDLSATSLLQERNNRFIDNDAKILVNDIFSIKETANHLVTDISERSRAFIQVQNGCNHRCTFCIIPYGRGNSRSVPIGEITNQVRLLVAKGFEEIVLTGVDITDYGLDLPSQPRLGAMIRRLIKNVPEIKRIRLSSVDVAEIDQDIMHLVRDEERFMPHFHLSLQAGDDMILKRMKRRHTRGDILDFVEKVRNIRSDVVFGADIIAGFPTETEEMFQNSLKIIDEADIIHAHIFPYSERDGTPAAKIPKSKQVPKDIRKERARLMREASLRRLQSFALSRVGRPENILVEKNNVGLTEHFLHVNLANSHFATGENKEENIGKVISSKVFSRDDYLALRNA